MAVLVSSLAVVAPTPANWGHSVAKAAPITCSNGTSPFTLTYDTTGLTTPTITLPLSQVGAPGVVVDWGDGTTSTYTAAGNRAHTFPAPGPYTVQICGTLQTFGTGSAMPNVSTLISVDSFGTLGTLDSLSGAFFGATNLVSVPSTLPLSVTKIPQTFQGATKINDPNIKLWDTSRITNMTGTFAGATTFNQNLSSWSLAANQGVGNMFNGATAFNNGCATGVYTCPLTWTTPNLISTFSAFENARYFNQSLNTWDMTKVLNPTSMFYASGFNNGCAVDDTSCPMNWTFPVAYTFATMFMSAPIFNQNITTFMSGANNVTSLYAMFRESPKFNNGNDDPAINTWQTSKVTTFKEMFLGPGGASMAFNRHVEGWSMAAALDLSWMFRGATAFNNGCAKGDRTCPLTWSNTGKVTTINSFVNYGNSAGSTVMSFDQSINSWDITSMVDFGAAFGWSVFNNGGEPFWPGKTVKTGAIMNRMFAVNSWFNVPVGGLNVSGVKNMGGMFTVTNKFDQDLSGWRVSGLTTATCCYPVEHSMQEFFASNPYGSRNGISVTNYEKWLNSLTTDGGATTYVPAGTIMDMGNSRYTCNAKAVRDALGLKFTIRDGGMAPLPAPTINSVTAGDGFVDVSFSAPKCFGVATSPTFYYYTKDNGAFWYYFPAPSPASADGTVRIPGNNGQTYPIRLRAYLGGQGDGAPSDKVDGTPVGPLGLDPVVSIADKTYDGTTRATITGCQLRLRGTSPAQYITDPSIASCDVSAATAVFLYPYARPASAWGVTITGAALTGPRASEYRLFGPAFSSAKINPATLSVVPSNVEVTAGTAAGDVVYPYVLSGWVNGETAASYTTTAPTCSAPGYTDAKTASDPASPISCTGGTLANPVPWATLANYVFDRTATAQISVASGPPPVSVQATITASDKEYDSNRNATISCAISGADPSDTLSCDVSGATVQFDTKNVGNSKTVTATGITLSVDTNNSGNVYVLSGSTWTASASITPKSVTPSITVNNKVYDRTTSATIDTCTLAGVIASEVSCDKSGAVATFDTANVGTDKTVSASGLVLSGNSLGNYLATSDAATALASITPRPVTVKAVADTKVYDGTRSSTLVPVSGLLGGETTNATQSFDTAGVGNDKDVAVDIACEAVTITDNAVLVTDNYDITCEEDMALGEITPAPVTISPVAESKPYDATIASNGTPVVSGLFGSDAMEAVQVFDSPNVGDRNLEIDDYSFTSGDPANYTVDDTPTVKGQISAIGPIRVKASSVAYGFDGSTPTLGYTATGFVGEDDFVTDPQCKVFATTDLAYSTAITNFSTITPNSYNVHCFDGDAGSNYTGIEYDDGSFQPQGTATYTGPSLVFAKTGTPAASVTLSATVDPGTVDCFVLFSLYDIDDTDTPTYVFGPFNAASGAVATTRTVAVGVYTVEITAFGNCYGRSDDLLTVASSDVGRGSVGGGFYRNINSLTPPKVNLGYEVQVRSSSKNGVTTTTTKGQVLWMAKVGWRVKASINYSSTDGTTRWTRISCPSKPDVWPGITRPTCGWVQGSGVLQRFNPETYSWETYDAGITFTMTIYDGGQVTTCKLKSSCRTTLYPDFVGMTIWASDGSQILPGTVTPGIPTSEPVRLANGQTRIF